MDRRLAGVALLILAMVAAVLVGARNAKQLSGSPQTAPVADPPVVGDCVVDAPLSYEYPPVLATGPCSTERYGEVIAVFPHTLKQVTDQTSMSAGFPSAVDEKCARQGVAYLGSSIVESDSPAETPPAWYPSVAIGPTLSAPRPLAEQFGADWTACVVLTYATSDVAESAPYRGSLKSVYRTFDFPPSTATCWVDTPAYDLPAVACDEPHAVEEFGSVWDVDPDKVRPSDMLVSCRALIERMTDLADPTAGGALRVSVAETSRYTYQTGDRTVVSYSCLVHSAPGKTLTGPLLNLQDGPLPVR